MKEKQINIKSIPGELHLLIEFISFGKVTAKYKYFNFIGNGDKLAFACGDWVGYGILPQSVNGLVRLDN